MRKIFSISIILAISLAVFSQKVSVTVARTKDASVSEWHILDEKFMQIITGNEYMVADIAAFSLEANKRYYFFVSVSEINIQDTALFSLSLNNEPILLTYSGDGSGDHFYPFFTGIRKDKEAKITGGTDTDISDFPWQVYLEASDFTCGGSIIDKNWIITAAHCTKDDNDNTISPDDMDVIVGANNPRGDPDQGKKYYVSQVIVHEDFNSETLDNDIALLRLRDPVDYDNAAPIKLVSAMDAAEGATDPGVMSWVTGYGLIKIIPSTYPTTLQKVQLPIISRSQALVVWKDIPETDLMAGYLNGNKDACTGDSGGPLVVPVTNEYKLAGLVSWGSTKCNTYGAYTRISDFESWITAKTGIEITFIAPEPVGDTIICEGTVSSDFYVEPVSGATGYVWQISPDGAGTIRSNSNHATVSWNPGFTGTATIMLRILKINVVSDWSELATTVAEKTRIISQSNDMVICAKKSINLLIESKGFNLTYSWYKNNTLIQSGSSATLGFSGVSLTDSGIYKCRITGYCGSVMSDDINLTVLPVTTITGISPDTEVDFSEDIALEVDADGHNLTYQWIKNNIPTTGENNQVLEVQNVNADDIGLYQVTVTGTCGVRSSEKIYVYVKKKDDHENPAVYVWPTLVSDLVNIAISNDYNYNVMVTSLSGSLIMQKSACRYKTEINMTNLQPGIYIMTIYNSNFRKSIKLVKN